MKWRPEYSIGIREVDTQHERLLDLFAHLEQAIEKERSWSDIHFGLVNLLEFAEYHFAFEEALMRLFGYPGAEEHRQAHHGFIVRIKAKVKKTLLAEVEPDLLKMLRDWLVEHILGTDRDYARHILGGARVVTA